MKILSIDTSSDMCSVAILEDTTPIKEISLEDANTHSVKLMPQIEHIFMETNLTLKDIDLLACDKGPGSFTGIRIGIATIKAFCDTTSIPAMGISSLIGLAYPIDYPGYICSLIDAKNGNVYYALWDNSQGKHQQIGQYLTEDINYITEILKNCNKPVFFVGNGSILYQDMLKLILYKNAIFPSTLTCHKLNAVSIGMVAFNLYQNNQYQENITLSPLYLRKSSAERLLEEKSNGTMP